MMKNQFSKLKPENQTLGKEIKRFKQKKLANFLVSLLFLGAAIYIIHALLNGSQFYSQSYSTVATGGLRIPGPVMWIIALVMGLFFCFFIYRAFFTKLEVIFYEYGIAFPRKNFFYADLTSITWQKIGNSIFVKVSGSAGEYMQEVDGLNKAEIAFLESLLHFLQKPNP